MPKANRALQTLNITQHPTTPSFPELEPLRYASFIYNLDIVRRDHPDIPEQKQHGLLPHNHADPIWDQEYMTTHMESQAQHHRDKAVDKLTNKLTKKKQNNRLTSNQCLSETQKPIQKLGQTLMGTKNRSTQLPRSNGSH